MGARKVLDTMRAQGARGRLAAESDEQLTIAVRNNLQELLGNLLVASKAAADASIILTLRDPGDSAALGSELDVAAGRMNAAGVALRNSTAAWEVLVGRAKDKRFGKKRGK